MLKLGLMLSNLRLPLREAIETAGRMGVDGVQLWTAGGELDPEELSETLRRDLMAALETERLEISALCADYGISFADPSAPDFLVPRMKGQVDLANVLGVGIVTTHIGAIPEGENAPEWRAMEKQLAELSEYAESYDVLLASETGPESPGLLARFLSNPALSHIKVNYDPANLVMTGFDPVEGVPVLAPWIVHTHAKDAVRHPDGTPEEAPIGEGHVDWPRYIAALVDSGYDGYLTIEREVGEDPVGDISGALEFLRMQVL